VAAPATGAFLAINIRLDGAVVAGFDVRNLSSYSDDFNAQLVTGNARVAIKRHLSQITGIVAATDADAMDANQRLAGLRLIRFRHVDLPEVQRFFQLDGFHGDQLFFGRPSRWPIFFTGLKNSSTSPSNS